MTGTAGMVTGATDAATKSGGTVTAERVAGGRIAGGGRTAVAGGSGGGAKVFFGINVMGVGTSTKVIFGMRVIGVGLVTTGILIGPAEALIAPMPMTSVLSSSPRAKNLTVTETNDDLLIMYLSCRTFASNA